MRYTRFYVVALVWLISFPTAIAASDGVFVRFRLSEPAGAKYYVKLGGSIHQANWFLPNADIPTDAEKPTRGRVASGQFTEWFDLAAHAGKNLHTRMNLAGGIAEFPNVTAQFMTEPASPGRNVLIELATVPRAENIVKRWHEKFQGDTTSFLVSP